MYYQKTTSKDFKQASKDLEDAVIAHKFGVLHVHDLGNTLRSKGIDFKEDCHVLEVCSPAQAEKVLSIDMQLNMALPCRISVWTENGETKIGMIKPEKMLADLSDDSRLHEIAKEVEQATKTMIDQAA